MTLDRLDDRNKLLAGFDDTRRDLDASGTMEAMDKFNRQAISILTSGRLAEALDLDKEPAKSHQRYTPPAGRWPTTWPTSPPTSPRRGTRPSTPN